MLRLLPLVLAAPLLLAAPARAGMILGDAYRSVQSGGDVATFDPETGDPIDSDSGGGLTATGAYGPFDDDEGGRRGRRRRGRERHREPDLRHRGRPRHGLRGRGPQRGWRGRAARRAASRRRSSSSPSPPSTSGPARSCPSRAARRSAPRPGPSWRSSGVANLF